MYSISCSLYLRQTGFLVLITQGRLLPDSLSAILESHINWISFSHYQRQTFAGFLVPTNQGRLAGLLAFITQDRHLLDSSSTILKDKFSGLLVLITLGRL